ncbi:TetR/AcrR family transcriptional regulator [Mycobacterium sp. B14F4]|uniref:TetR/AcrR family transcriptional regulator n=1 Tax=Mycobacterium sp. B14F4 TaxID=3153565 RepID=UPI00325F8D88
MDRGAAPRRKYDNSRRRADAEARQRTVIEAATALFVEHGFGPTTIDQIATAAKVSPQTIYATYGSKAAVLFRAIDVAVAGDYDEAPLPQRLPALAEASDGHGVHFAAAAHFVRAMHDRVAPLMRVMEQAASVDPTLEEMRTKLLGQVRAGCAALIAQLGPRALRPGLSQEEATDIVFTVQAPYLYSMFTVDLGWSADRYEEWLADAVPRLLLRKELLG